MECKTCGGFLNRDNETLNEPIAKDNWCICVGFVVPSREVNLK